MKLWETYYTPRSVDELLALLRQHAGEARIIAGGTDLLVDIRAAHMPPQKALIDITAVHELCEIVDEGDSVLIGAGVTHNQIVRSQLLASRATCLVESCGVVGGPQVRNVATLGGNVAHALPAGDGTTSLVALNAEAEIVKDGQRQWRPIAELYLGPGKSLLDSTRDVLLRFRVPLHTADSATAFSRIMRPQGVALPILGCAVWVELDADRTIMQASRVCLAPVAPTPIRAEAVEAALNGQPAHETSIERAIVAARDSLKPRTSKYRATADYRQEMIEVLLRRTLNRAIERVRTGVSVPEGVGV